MHQHQNLFGLVLAGGRSRRMGQDKGLIAYHGKPQREFLFDALNGLCSAVYTSCRADQNVDEGLHPLRDVIDVQSPLNGIISAFRFAPNLAWLAVAVDLPNVTGEVLHTLVRARDLQKLATCFFDAGAHAPEPLLTIWEPAAYPLLGEHVRSGNVSPRAFLMRADVNIVHGIPSSVFRNVNNPADRDAWLTQD